MHWIAFVAATQLSPPPPIDLRALFSADDMPGDYMPAESDRTVGIRVTVKPDGRVQDCTTEYTSGIDRLDVLTCKLVKRRAKYAPAPLQAGIPSFAVYRTSIRWVVTGFANPASAPNLADLTLTVNQLPDGLKAPTGIGVKFDVDESGHASSCSAEEKPGQTRPFDPALVSLACDQFLRAYKPVPAKDENGRPVPSVQDAMVGFVIK
jgi:hypothetical protein